MDPPHDPQRAEITMRPIGSVSTEFTEPESTPIQAQRDRDAQGRVVIEAAYRSALEGLAEFDYVFLITYLDHVDHSRPDADGWTVVPFLLGDTTREVGAFATRHPARPNPIGLSLVRVVEVRPDGFDFEGVDMTNGTTVLDIKPWVPAFDTPQKPPSHVRTGWYSESVLNRPGTSPSELSADQA